VSQTFLVHIAGPALTEGEVAAAMTERLGRQRVLVVSELADRVPDVEPLRVVPGADPLVPVHLTPRERQVLDLIVAGVPARLHHEMLGCAWSTAHGHRMALYGKLEAAPGCVILRAIQLGLVRAEREGAA
jgi:ATP/maltotriose-dependent transcriptional regulator MalT